MCMQNENGEEWAINEEENEKSEDKERKRKEKSCWKITLNVQVQQRPNFNKYSVLSSVLYVFNGMLQVGKTYLNAGVNLGPGTWIP